MKIEVSSLVDYKIKAIDVAEKAFKSAVRGLDEEIKNIIKEWLASLNITDGKIEREANKKMLLQLIRRLKSKVNKEALTGPVRGLLKNLDDVEKYTKQLLELENDIDLDKLDLSTEKKEAIRDITTTLLNDDVINANVLQPLRKIAFRHVTTGISFKDAQKEFEKVTLGNPLYKYARTITAEALMRYDGMINQRVSDEYQLDAFRIVGSLIKTSQEVCIHMINETGPFEDMAVNGKYPMALLPKIVNIVKRYPGAVAGLDESNYFIFRNHWGCRHVFIPTRFTERDKAAMGAPKQKSPVPNAKKSPVPKTNKGKGNSKSWISTMIKGDEPTNNEIKKILKEYAVKNPDNFRRGLDKISIVSGKKRYYMLHSMLYKPITNEWLSGSTIRINDHNFGGFNALTELKGALSAIKKGDDLTFNQEYAIEGLWHEILHAKTKTKRYYLTDQERKAMETINQFVARHTYDKFLKRLGGKASHKEDILDKGHGYKKWITEFRNDLKSKNITEEEALKHFEPLLMSDYKSLIHEKQKFLNR